MKLYSDQLDKLIKHFLVREYKERSIDGMNIREFLPLCAALLYPYRNDKIENDSKSEVVLPIIESVKSFANKKKGLENYNLNGLRLYFQQNWLPTLEKYQQIRLIKGISLITQLEDNGFFSINGNERVHERYLNIQVLDISNNYGGEDYEIKTEVHLINKTTEIEDNSMKNEKHDREKDLTSLTPLKEFLHSNFSLNQYPKGLYQYDYFWQFKLNSSQYEDLKDILKNLNLAKQPRLLVKEISGYGTVALSVALYISEWYKRESPSLDGDRCLETIGLTSAKSSNIWEKSKLPKELLHQDEEGNQMRQTAICVLGGLPLVYVNNSNRFDAFVNKIANISQDKNISDEDIEDIVDCFDNNNGVFKRSLQYGSCKEYVNACVNYLIHEDNSDLPFSKDDLDNQVFSTFVYNLRHGFDNTICKTEINVWTCDMSENIESEFTINIGHSKENVFTISELGKLGFEIPDDANTFTARLIINRHDGSSYTTNECRIFNRIGNGCMDFCGAFGSYITIDIDLFRVRDILLQVEYNGHIEKSTSYRFVVPSVLELYSTQDAYLWTTITNNKREKVLLYDRSKYSLSNSEDIPVKKSDKDYIWEWINQKEDVTLINETGESILFKIGSAEKITVDFCPSNLNKDIVLSNTGRVQSVLNGNPCEELPLLYHKDSHLMLKCDGYKDDDLTTNFIIEYKPFNATRYIEWTDNNSPEQGFITLRIKARDSKKRKKSWIGNAYYIPNRHPIVTRNLRRNYITINIEHVNTIDEELRAYFDSSMKQYKDSPDHDLNSLTIEFRIGDENNYVIIEVYRAFYLCQIFNKDNLIKSITNLDGVNAPIAQILHKDILIRTIDEKGIHNKRIEDKNYRSYFDDPRTLSRNINNIGEEDYTYIYLNSFCETEPNNERKIREIALLQGEGSQTIQLNVSDKHIDKYHFYYWSGIPNDPPTELDRIKIGNRHYEFELPSPLEGKAMVFQSLLDCHPNLYFRPFYADSNWAWHNYLNRYERYNIDYLLYCYNLAVSHNTYFCIFPALSFLQRREYFTEFIKEFTQKKNYELSKKDIEDLTRLAKELAMDWFFVQRRELFRGLEENDKLQMREVMERLLLSSPILQGRRAEALKFIKFFLSNTSVFKLRNGQLPRQFINALDYFKYKKEDLKDSDTRIDFLNDLIHTDINIFAEICSILNK